MKVRSVSESTDRGIVRAGIVPTDLGDAPRRLLHRLSSTTENRSVQMGVEI